MICPRCGTEHEDPQKICPRCGFGRPRVRKPLPHWLQWTIALSGVILAAVLVVLFFRAKFYNSEWMNGSWEGGGVAITFNTEDGTFLYSNGDLVLNGDYSAKRDSFELRADDGKTYFYRYTRVGAKKIKLTFTQEETTVRITLTKMNDDAGDAEEEEEEEEPEAEW